MLRQTVLVRALAVAFSAAAMSAAVTPAAMAQSAAGSIYAKVAPGSATSVVVQNIDTNLTRTAPVDADGSFRMTGLPIGTYKVTMMSGSAAGATTQVEVIAGQGVEAAFAADVSAAQTVQVTARRSRIDVTNATNGATFTSKDLAKLPVGRSVDSIIQLAPNTTLSDPTYPAGASIAGGAASENAYYINGFPVTNPLTQMGASELPFGAIAQAEIKTGGYGAEFGRSVGGVINVTGKSGTNNWEAGGLVTWSPDELRANAKDQYFPTTGLTNAGVLRFRNSENTTDSYLVGTYVGGPIIEDKLFMFAAYEQTQTDRGTVVGGFTTPAAQNAINGYQVTESKQKRYYAKLDWNITDNHRLEFTAIGDTPEVLTQRKGYNYNTSQIGSVVTSEQYQKNDSASGNNIGGDYQFLRYQGNITDNFSVSALAGQSKTTHIFQPTGYNPTIQPVTAATENRAPGLNYTSPQTFGNINFSGATDKYEFARLDLEYKLGDHTIRVGGDDSKTSALNAGTLTAGGNRWIYLRTTTPNSDIAVPGGTVPAPGTYPNAGPLAAEGYYVNKNIFSTVSNAYAGQSAQYIEDRWQVTKDVQVTMGIRDEQFYNMNSNKVKYLEMKNQINPRLSATWDVRGDSSLKVYGSAGRYTVQIPTRVTLRAANGATNTSQYFAYTGTDANGAPTGLTQLTDPLSANGEFGQAPDATSVRSTNLKPSAQDELTVGFEQALSQDLIVGVRGTYRTLRTTIDDFCDGRVFRRYALENGITTIDDATWDPNDPHYSYFHCASFNPGEDQDFLIDFMQNGNFVPVRLTAEQLGFEKPKREYMALDFSAEHPYRNGWYGKVNYTWSRNTGNTEGQTMSDLNTGQTDLSATVTWDYAELMQHANGLLPNDRTHQIKAFGFLDVTPEITIGGNLSIQSGRPRGCLGGNPNPKADPDWETVGPSPDYGVEHYCFGMEGSVDANGDPIPAVEMNVPAPRGSMGRLPWNRRLDLNVAYRPLWMKGLQFKLDVFNVFDEQGIQKLNEQYNTGSGTRSTLYGSVNSYYAPRSMRLSAEYNHRF